MVSCSTHGISNSPPVTCMKVSYILFTYSSLQEGDEGNSLQERPPIMCDFSYVYLGDCSFLHFSIDPRSLWPSLNTVHRFHSLVHYQRSS